MTERADPAGPRKMRGSQYVMSPPARRPTLSHPTPALHTHRMLPHTTLKPFLPTAHAGLGARTTAPTE